MNRQTEQDQDWNVYQQIAKRAIEARQSAFESGFVLGMLLMIILVVIWFALVKHW